MRLTSCYNKCFLHFYPARCRVFGYSYGRRELEEAADVRVNADGDADDELGACER